MTVKWPAAVPHPIMGGCRDLPQFEAGDVLRPRQKNTTHSPVFRCNLTPL